MAIIEWTDEQRRDWAEWLATRPPKIRAMAHRFPPNHLFRIKKTGQRVTIYSYSEDGTLSVNVTGEYNLIPYAETVFGIKPEDLEECDMPHPDELVGELTTDPAEIEILVEARRRLMGFGPSESLQA